MDSIMTQTDPIMTQAAAVKETISSVFDGRQPKFYAVDRDHTSRSGKVQIEFIYDSPKRPNSEPCGVPKDWKYYVLASVFLNKPRISIQAEAICRPPDTPDRKLGRAIAAMRIAEAIDGLGFDVLAMHKGTSIVIPPLLE